MSSIHLASYVRRSSLCPTLFLLLSQTTPTPSIVGTRNQFSRSSKRHTRCKKPTKLLPYVQYHSREFRPWLGSTYYSLFAVLQIKPQSYLFPLYLYFDSVCITYCTY